MSPTRKPYLQEEVESLKAQIDRLESIVKELSDSLSIRKENVAAIDKYIRDWHMGQGSDPDGN